jgi:hypothetical protein
MIRREFIAGLGAVAWPLAVRAVARPLNTRAQQGERVRRIGVIGLGNENDPFAKLRLSNVAAIGPTETRTRLRKRILGQTFENGRARFAR